MTLEYKEKIDIMLNQRMKPHEIIKEVPYTEAECLLVIKEILNSKRTKIISSSKLPVHNDYIRVLFISDTHIGHKQSDIELLEKAYLYADRRNIAHVIHCGDLIDGVYKSNYSIQKQHEKQLEYLLDIYPYESGIKTLLLLGNHDTKNNSDILKSSLSKRSDIEILGEKIHKLILNREEITLMHQSLDLINNYKISSDFNFLGHYHRYKRKYILDKNYIFLPSIKKSSYNSAGWVDAEFVFVDDKIVYSNIRFIEEKKVDKAKVKMLK